MKRFLFCLLFIFIISDAYAQKDSSGILGKTSGSGYFITPTYKITSINNQSSSLLGGNAGWVINFPSKNSLEMGGGGYVLLNAVETGVTKDSGQQLYLTMGFGGLYLELIHHTNQQIHISGSILFGAGGVNANIKGVNQYNYESSQYTIIEPGIHINYNISNFVRLGAGIDYRLITGTNMKTVSDANLSGVSGVINLKFGKF